MIPKEHGRRNPFLVQVFGFLKDAIVYITDDGERSRNPFLVQVFGFSVGQREAKMKKKKVLSQSLLGSGLWFQMLEGIEIHNARDACRNPFLVQVFGFTICEMMGWDVHHTSQSLLGSGLWFPFMATLEMSDAICRNPFLVQVFGFK